MDNILSTLKGEYARTLLLILIPGAIAFEPFSILLYKYFDLHIKDLKEYIVIVSLVYFLAALLVGFIIQDLGARLEMILDKLYCLNNESEGEKFDDVFEDYLFNKKEEDYIVTHYYRSMLVRMKFELHTCASIFLLWIGSFLRAIIDTEFHLSWPRTLWFVSISLVVFLYLLIEAYRGVETLHHFRTKINEKFKS